MSPSHTQGAFPVAKPYFSPEKRHALAQDVLRNVRHPKPLPDDFDHIEASQNELQQHGLPPRPENNPEQEATWKELISKTKKAQLVKAELNTYSKDNETVIDQAQRDSQTRNCTGSNWAGAVIPKSKFSHIQATWGIPNPFPGKGDGPSWHSAAWIGLDGWSNTDVLLGGTGHDITKCTDGSLTREIYSWYQWFPAGPIHITNFPLSVGDKVFCVIWSVDPNYGCFYIMNYDTNKYTSLAFEPPAGTYLKGTSAEWVVQSPSDTVPEADFKFVEFRNCHAKRDKVWEDLSSAITIVSKDDDDTFCTAETKEEINPVNTNPKVTTLVVTYHSGSRK